VAPGARIITDDWSGYAGLTKHGYVHVSVAERGDPQVAEEFMPITHLVFSNLKTWLRSIHHGLSPQHLQAYLNEFTFRFNRRFYPFNAFRSLLGIAGDVTAPTYAELYAIKSRSTTTAVQNSVHGLSAPLIWRGFRTGHGGFHSSSPHVLSKTRRMPAWFAPGAAGDPVA
jgi:hypothetical protein